MIRLPNFEGGAQAFLQVFAFAGEGAVNFSPNFLAAVALKAEKVPGIPGGWFTNALVVSILVVGVVILVTQIATRNMQRVPGNFQNLFELLVEGIYNMVESLVGKKLAPRAFPILATIFMFFLFSNWFGLVPGVGTIGWGESSDGIFLKNVTRPLLRPPAADLNTNFAIAGLFMLYWLFVSIKEVGLVGFLKHIFAPKGDFRGVMQILMTVIFFIVGIIEIISIAFRPVSLSFRIYGNVFAGENLLHTVANLGTSLGFPEWLAFLMRVAVPIPFYFLELMVGFVQAMVFALLCAVYIQLSTTHDEDDH